MRVHGKSKRRTQRKFHATEDHGTPEITAASLTSNYNSRRRNKGFNQGYKQCDITTVTGDKAYENRHAYNAIAALRKIGTLLKTLISKIVGFQVENNGKKILVLTPSRTFQRLVAQILNRITHLSMLKTQRIQNTFRKTKASLKVIYAIRSLIDI